IVDGVGRARRTGDAGRGPREGLRRAQRVRPERRDLHGLEGFEHAVGVRYGPGDGAVVHGGVERLDRAARRCGGGPGTYEGRDRGSRRAALATRGDEAEGQKEGEDAGFHWVWYLRTERVYVSGS